MLALSRSALKGSLLLLPIVIGCNEGRPLAPDAAISLAASGAVGLGTPSNPNSTAVSATQINLAWTDNSPNEAGFEVHRATSPGGAFTVLATTGPNVAAHSDVGLTPLTQYCYQVRAFKKSGKTTSYSAFSFIACATTLGPPQPPSYADARPESSSEVGVRWSDNSSTEDGFRLERSATVAGPWATARTTGANVTTARESGLTSEQQVCYRVIAFNAHGESAPSNADCTTPPAAATNLTAVAGVQGIDLAWADNSGVEQRYEVERAADGVTFSIVANLPANSSSYHDGAALSNTTYWYRVRANRDGGFSDPSNVASAVGNCAPTSDTEICDNGIDDDCDGLADLGLDPDCGYSYDCPCGLGYTCNYLGFCVPSCNDGYQNGGESDVDCGGYGCEARCQAGQQCSVNADCASGVCGYGGCQNPGGQP